ncbi:MAG: AbrB/MazE/SpoVT family DNA-binding domain-containing protein [Methanoregula sp.]
MAQKSEQQKHPIAKEAHTIRTKTASKHFVEEPQPGYSPFPDERLDRSPQNIKAPGTGQEVWRHRGCAVTGLKRVHTGILPLRDLKRELVTIDRSGRMVLPKKIRDRFPANRFEVKVAEDRIELIPIEPLSSLLGSLPDIDLEKIYREHNQEVDEEDEE